mmetsp:Transcript_1526/g.3432  ORF Transcript_1526/g.3432 Transcript_1526/m.3432 type:complete len:389 (+) Transcript_1526:630-1796(+)
MFFFRSMIFKTPSFVISPMSPVWNHPSGSRDAQFTSATSAAQVTTWPVTGMGHADRIKTQVVAPADTETAATQGRFLRAPWHPREPPRRTEDLLGHLLALVVPREDGVAPDADLSARGVRKGVVVHVGNRLEADLHPGQRQPHVRPDPPGDRHAAPGHRLCQAVTLDDVAHHADLEELLHVRAERRSPGADQPDAAAERLLDLGEDELVEERRGLFVGAALAHELELAVEGKVEEGALQPPGRLHLGKDAVVDPVKHAGHPTEEGGPQRLDVVHEVLDVPAPVADAAADADHQLLDRPVENVRQREVGQVHLVLGGGLAERVRQEALRGRDLREEVPVGDHDPLRLTRRPAGVHDCAEVVEGALRRGHDRRLAFREELVKALERHADV